jgi:O-acetyl-ADP-ribose deacetylase (regulator of RNase III)
MIKVVRGDLTKSSADAIVNAANEMLTNQAGVAGAISRAGGASFQKESEDNVRQLGLVKTGQARPQRAQGSLKCQYVINAVGPIYNPEVDQSELLFSAYYNSLRVAFDLDLKTIAFPAISTGIFSYPAKEAAAIAADALKKGLLDFNFQQIEIVILANQEFDDLAEVFLKEIEKINPFFNSLNSDQQEQLLTIKYPISLQRLANLSKVDFDLLSQLYQLGVIPNRKSLGEPEILLAGAQIGFFFGIFSNQELDEIITKLTNSQNPAKALLEIAFKKTAKSS